jgi:hypothetical protein
MNSVKINILEKLLFHWSVKHNNILRSDALISYWRNNPFALVNDALFVGLNDKQNEESN